MVIANTNVNMAGSTTRTVRRTQTTQCFMRNYATGEVRYKENTFESAFSNQMSESHENMYNNYKQEKQGDGVINNVLQPALTVQQRDSLQSLVAQLRNFLMDFRKRMSVIVGRLSFPGSEGISISLSNNQVGVDVSGGEAVSIWNVTNYTKYTHYECETLNCAPSQGQLT